MEDPKAWKPRQHGIVIGDKDRETTLGKNGIQSHASRLVGQISHWSGPGPGP